MKVESLKRFTARLAARAKFSIHAGNSVTTKPSLSNSLIGSVATFRFIHREASLSSAVSASVFTADDHVIDAKLIERIIAFYQMATKSDLGDSMWEVIFGSHHQEVHDALMDGDEKRTAEIYRYPGSSELFFGFDFLRRTCQQEFEQADVREVYAKLCLDGLVRFAESVKAIPLDNPETWALGAGVPYDVEVLLAKLSKACWPLSVPNPFPDEHGLRTSRGILSYRVPQALYQAWRIKQLVKGMENPRILEIGAGLGRTAYYAHELGIKDYTIVDIPLTATAQAYFLGRTHGEDQICLDGESRVNSSEKIKIFTPQTFLGGDGKYDLIVNVDSLTEMDISTAKGYWQKIKKSTNLFLSINHETNPCRVQDLIAEDLPNLDVSRGVYWMRHGYVEEVVKRQIADVFKELITTVVLQDL